jgi:hypothetical protein
LFTSFHPHPDIVTGKRGRSPASPNAELMAIPPPPQMEDEVTEYTYGADGFLIA